MNPGQHINNAEAIAGAGNGPADAGGCPVFSNKYRVDFSDPGTTLTEGIYSTAFSHSGSGKFVGFVLKVTNQTNVKIKFTIDTTEVLFELTGQQILDAQIGNPGAVGLIAQVSAGGPVSSNSTNQIGFFPHCPINYASEYKLEIQKTSAASNTLDRYIVTSTKET